MEKSVLRRIEEVALNALQTQRQLFYDGWLLRLSRGSTKRARSVNAHFGSTLPLDGKIGYCERLYARQALPTLFRITPFDHPAGLDEALGAHGYEAFDETLVQTLDLPRAPEIPECAEDVSVETPSVDAFVDAAGEIRGSSPSQRDAHRMRLVHSPHVTRCVVIYGKGRPLCTAQLILEDGHAGLFDVGTSADARGSGYATLACTSLLSWAWQYGAHTGYLQVGADNGPALAVYRRLGFTTAYSYHYRAQVGECE